MAEMRPVYDAEELSRSSKYLGPSIPKMLLDFLQLFFAKLNKSFGLKIFFAPIESVDKLQIDPITFGALKNFKQQGIVRSFSVEKHLYTDEPRLFQVFVEVPIQNQDVKLVRANSIFSYEKAWDSVVQKSLQHWSFNNFDLPASERTLLKASQLSTDLGLDDGKDQLECIYVEELNSKQKASLPLQMFSAKHARRVVDRQYEPSAMPLALYEVGVGKSKEEAEFQALLQMIGQNTKNLFETGNCEARHISLDAISSVVSKKVRDNLDRYNLKAQTLFLNTDFPVLVILMIIFDESGIGPTVTTGLGVDLGLDGCLEKAFLEASQARLGIRNDDKSLENYPFWTKPTEKIEYLTEEFLLKKQKQVSSTDHKKILEILYNKDWQTFSTIISPQSVFVQTGLLAVAVKMFQLRSEDIK